MQKKFVCPCCKKNVFEQGPGSLEICPVCFWQDDLFQFENPDSDDGANSVSLVESIKNYAKYGACEKRFVKFIKNRGDIYDGK